VDRIEGERNFYKFPVLSEVVRQLIVVVWACAPGRRNFELNWFGYPEDGDSAFF
jgi:hypothetical protein